MPCVASSARAPPRSRARVAATVAVRSTCDADAVPRSVSTAPIADRQRQLAAAGEHRLAERSADVLGERQRFEVRRHAGHEHGEVVAGQAADRRLLAEQRHETRADADEHLVAGAIAEAVVEPREAVDVDEQHRGVALLAARALERLLETILEQRPVGEAGQRVAQRQPRDLGIGAPARDRRAEDVGDRLREALVVGPDRLRVGGGDREHAGRRAAVAFERHRQRAAHPGGERQAGGRELGELGCVERQRPASVDRAPQHARLRLADRLAVAGERAEADRALAAQAAVGVDGQRDATIGAERLEQHRHAGGAEVGGVHALQRALAERDDERLARDPLGALMLDELVVGEVADEAGVRRLRAAHARDRDLDGQRRAVGALGLELDALVEDPRPSALQQPSQAVAMGVAPGRRNDQLGHVLPDGLGADVAEHPLGGGVELEHRPVLVDRHDRVQRRAQHGGIDPR